MSDTATASISTSTDPAGHAGPVAGDALCRLCGYSLRGLARDAACPECHATERADRMQAASRRRRLLALLPLAGASGLLGVAAWLQPASGGVGTHEQLALPPCGWVLAMDLPCPTCGMTTAFAHAADGHLLASFFTQPLGFVLALATAVTAILSLLVLVTGAPLARPIFGLWGSRSGWWLAGIVVAAWGYKILSYKELLP